MITMRDPYIAFAIFTVIFIMGMYMLFRKSSSEEEEVIEVEHSQQLEPSPRPVPQPTPQARNPTIRETDESIYDATPYPLRELFENTWVFHIDADKCKSKWDLAVPETTRVTFEFPTKRDVVMKLESADSKGGNRVRYEVQQDGVLFSTPEGQPLYFITKNSRIRLIQVEKTVTDGEKFEWELRRN